MYQSTGTQFAGHGQWLIGNGGWSDSSRWLSGDFDGDGDGRADVMAVWNDGGANTFTLRRSAGSGFITEHWAIRDGGWMDSTRWLAGDFDGDGLTDIAGVWNDGGRPTITVYRSAGTHFEPSASWAIRDGTWSDSMKWVAGDFDGDGLSDIAAIWNDGGTNTLTVDRSTRSSFHATRWRVRDGGWMDFTKWLAGDFDGDGLTDIAAVWNEGGRPTITVYRSAGTHFEPGVSWAIRDGTWSDSMKWVAGDFDGDGLSDIAAIWNDGGTNTLTVWQSTGTKFNSQKHRDIHDGEWMDQIRWLSGKFR